MSVTLAELVKLSKVRKLFKKSPFLSNWLFTLKGDDGRNVLICIPPWRSKITLTYLRGLNSSSTLLLASVPMRIDGMRIDQSIDISQFHCSNQNFSDLCCFPFLLEFQLSIWFVLSLLQCCPRCNVTCNEITTSAILHRGCRVLPFCSTLVFRRCLFLAARALCEWEPVGSVRSGHTRR